MAATIALKPIDQQVIVITGASSGIGLATAKAAAGRGARIVAAARSEATLAALVQEIKAAGGDALYVVCDVAERAQLHRVALAATERYDRIDTWVNNAGVSIYGRLDEVTEADSRRLFETNFWGVYNGSLVAAKYLRSAGGALINVGSDVVAPLATLQGIFAASKQAVRTFTDALRIELQEVDAAPVSVTLVEPETVDTPHAEHARNYLGHEPPRPSPMVLAEGVAEAILAAATTPMRLQHVTARPSTMRPAPPADPIDRATADEPRRGPDGALERPSEDVDGGGKVRPAHP